MNGLVFYPSEKGKQNEDGKVASPESVPIHPNNSLLKHFCSYDQAILELPQLR